jgi:protein-disulfide isomerase
MKKVSILFLIAGLFLGAGFAHQLQAQGNSGQQATITITEYSDYECPACAYFHPIVEKLKEEYGDQINFNLKYYPLSSHRYSALAARAAQAAKNQGKFNEMHSMIFENQKQWKASGNPGPIFIDYARKLNLDIEQFKNELNAAETQKVVMQQKQEGRQAGVRATPTFFIDGEKVDPLPRTYEQFEQIVQKYLDGENSGE